MNECKVSLGTKKLNLILILFRQTFGPQVPLFPGLVRVNTFVPLSSTRFISPPSELYQGP